MSIVWCGEVIGEEVVAAGEAISNMFTQYEIAGILTGLGWAVVGGIAYWQDRFNPPTSYAGLVYWWYGKDDPKQQDY